MKKILLFVTVAGFLIMGTLVTVQNESVNTCTAYTGGSLPFGNGEGAGGGGGPAPGSTICGNGEGAGGGGGPAPG